MDIAFSLGTQFIEKIPGKPNCFFCIKMPPKKKRTKAKIIYNWDDVLEWERQAKDVGNIAKKREEEEELIKIAAAKDLSEALKEDGEMKDIIEIKQEVVLEPNL